MSALCGSLKRVCVQWQSVLAITRVMIIERCSRVCRIFRNHLIFKTNTSFPFTAHLIENRGLPNRPSFASPELRPSTRFLLLNYRKLSLLAPNFDCFLRFLDFFPIARCLPDRLSGRCDLFKMYGVTAPFEPAYDTDALQSVRHYATEGPRSSWNMGLIVAGTAALAGGGYYYFATQTQPSPKAEFKQDIPAKAPGNTTFKGGDQGFIDLKLESVEQVSHNTKKFRFLLPDSGDVSGLKIACQA